MTRTIYFERKMLLTCILGVPTFLAMLAALLSVLFVEPPSGREPFVPGVLAFAALPLVMLGLSIYLMWSYFVHRIELSDQVLRVRQPLRCLDFELAKIDRLQWRRGVRLYTAGRKVTLDLPSYSPEDRLALIVTLRQAVPDGRQTGWPEYCRRAALPLYDRLFGEPVLSRTLEKGQVAITRQRYDRMAKWLVPCSVLLAIGLGPWTRWVSLFVVPGTALTLWWMLRSSTPKSGYVDKSLLGEREMLWLPIMFGVTIATLALTRLAEYFGADKQFTDPVFVVLCLSYIALIFYFGHRADKVRKKRLAEECPKSVARWQAIVERRLPSSKKGRPAEAGRPLIAIRARQSTNPETLRPRSLRCPCG